MKWALLGFVVLVALLFVVGLSGSLTNGTSTETSGAFDWAKDLISQPVDMRRISNACLPLEDRTCSIFPGESSKTLYLAPTPACAEGPKGYTELTYTPRPGKNSGPGFTLQMTEGRERIQVPASGADLQLISPPPECMVWVGHKSVPKSSEPSTPRRSGPSR